jgi:valyl-tRNA synthetase
MHWSKAPHIDEALILFGEKLKDTLSEVRKYKSERNLSMRAEMCTLNIPTERRFLEWLKQTEKDIQACSRATMIKYIFE